jgi:hypothetical protein
MGKRSTSSFWAQPGIDDRLVKLRAIYGPDWPRIARELGHTSPDAVRTYHDANVRAGKLPEPRTHIAPIITSLAEPAESPKEMWERAKKATTRDVKRARSLRLADVAIPDALPIGLTVVSDQHLRESGPVDVARMEADAYRTRDTDGLYALLGGDGTDNHVKHRAAMAAGGSAPRREWQLYDHYLSMFRPEHGPSKILAMISGNHDEFGKDMTGMDEVARLAKDHRLFYAPDEIVLTVTVGTVPYRVKVRHQYRYNSSFNKLHTVQRLWDMGDDDFDIGIVCHHHEGTVGDFAKHGRTIYAARPGSYQITSGYGRRYGFPLTSPTCPTFILYPDRFKIVAFRDIEDAAFHLTALRQEKAA